MTAAATIVPQSCRCHPSTCYKSGRYSYRPASSCCMGPSPGHFGSLPTWPRTLRPGRVAPFIKVYPKKEKGESTCMQSPDNSRQLTARHRLNPSTALSPSHSPFPFLSLLSCPFASVAAASILPSSRACALSDYCCCRLRPPFPLPAPQLTPPFKRIILHIVRVCLRMPQDNGLFYLDRRRQV